MTKLLELIQEQKKELRNINILREPIPPTVDGARNFVLEIDRLQDWHTASIKAVLEKVREKMEQYSINGYKFDHYMEHHMRHGYQKALQTQIDLLTETINSLSEAGGAK